MLQIFFGVHDEMLLRAEPFVDIPAGVTDSVQLNVELDDIWSEMDKVFVLFSGGDLPAPRPVVLEDGHCLIPELALQGESFTFGLVGHRDNRVAVVTNGIHTDLAGGSVEEVEQVLISVDLLMWLWQWYESGDGGNGGSGAAPSIVIEEASSEITAIARSLANPNAIVFWGT